MTRVVLLFLLLVIIAPSNTIGFGLGFYYAAISRNTNLSFLPLVLAAALFFASYNSTKIPESDLFFYWQSSEELARIDFFQLINLYRHEPGYYFMNWLFVRGLGFEWSSWVFVFSFAFYFSWLTGINIVLNFLKLDRTSSLTLLVFAMFFPLVFIQSAHLVRQYIAMGIGLLGLATFLITGRGWRYFIVAPIFHVAAFALLIVPLSARLGSRSQRAAVFYTLFVALFLVLAGRVAGENPEFLQSLGVPNLIIYGIGRLSQDQFYQLNDLSLIGLLFSTISLGASILGLYINREKIASISKEVNLRFTSFLTFNAVLSASIILLSLLGYTEPATRMLQFILLQFPVVLATLVFLTKTFRFFTIIAGVLMPILFFSYPSTWSYGDVLKVLLYPHYFYLIGA